MPPLLFFSFPSSSSSIAKLTIAPFAYSTIVFPLRREARALGYLGFIRRALLVEEKNEKSELADFDPACVQPKYMD
jgi:hypothetical protein